jgi:hypothetical protein
MTQREAAVVNVALQSILPLSYKRSDADHGGEVPFRELFPEAPVPDVFLCMGHEHFTVVLQG